MVKTQDEIVAYYQEQSREDMLGFLADAILPYLSADKIKPFVKEEADLSDYEAQPLTERDILYNMQTYMSFAWDKARDHRGISASRSVAKMRGWLWLLGDEETLAFANNDDNYPNYGAPILKKICEKYNFPIPEGEDVENMAAGNPCEPGCESGCGF